LVPFNYDVNPPLGNWISKQRQDFVKGIIDPGRKQRLDQLGFAWTLEAKRKEAAVANSYLTAEHCARAND
jgi:hypothetical protein